MARLHDSRHGSDADGIDDDDMPLTHEQAVVEADAELRRMTYHPVRKAVGIVVAMGVAIGASLGVGYMFGGDPGGIVTAITGVVCPQDAKYALDGCQHVRHLGASRQGGQAQREGRGAVLSGSRQAVDPAVARRDEHLVRR